MSSRRTQAAHSGTYHYANRDYSAGTVDFVGTAVEMATFNPTTAYSASWIPTPTGECSFFFVFFRVFVLSPGSSVCVCVFACVCVRVRAARA